MSMVNGVYPCAFDKDTSVHFVVWVQKSKIDELYQFVVDMIDSASIGKKKDKVSEPLIVGLVSDSALSMEGSPDSKYQVDFYSNAPDLNDAIDLFKIYFHKYSKYIYYQRDDDISLPKLRINTK